MAGQTYWEKLQDPRWQKKRLEILERDNWECLGCGGGDKTLHVHHGYYRKGIDPWDYENDTLYTYCEECHKELQSVLSDVYQEIGFVNTFGFLRNFHAALSQIRKSKGSDKRESASASLRAAYALRFLIPFDDFVCIFNAIQSRANDCDMDQCISLGMGCSV